MTVQPRELMFSFVPDQKTYDGKTDVTGTLTRTTELVSGDTVTASYKAEADSAEVSGSPANVTVTVTLDGEDAQYYKAVDPAGVKVDIVKAEVTDVKAPTPRPGLTYNGTDHGLITAGSSTQGEMKYYVGESAESAGAEDWKDAAAITGKDAGTYTVWYKVVGNSNHNDSAAKSIEVNIQPKEVTLSWVDGNMTYDGNAKNVTATTSDFVEEDTGDGGVSLKFSGGTETDVGEHTARAELTGARADNYTLAEDEHTYTITKAASGVAVSASDDPTYGSSITLTATVTAVDDAGKITGTVTFTAGGTELGSNVAVSGGKAVLTIDGTDTAKQKALFNAKEVTAAYSGDSNIDGGEGSKTDLTVAPRALTYTVTATNRDYNGETGIPVALEPDNLVSGDSVTLTAAGDLGSANADKYEKVNLSSIIKSGADADYYSVAGSAEGAAIQGGVTVSPLEVTLEWKLDGKDSFTIDYTGTAHTVTATVTNKALGGDVVGVTVKVAPKDGGEGIDSTATNAGTYTATATELTGAAKDNYKLPENPTKEITINKVGANATAPTAKNLTYTATAQALVEAGTPAGGTMMYALGENGETAPDNNAFNADIPTGTNAGTYYVWYYVQADGNHTDSKKDPVTVTIEKAPVSFEVSNNTFDYDTETHTATVTQTADESPRLRDSDFSVTYGTDKAASKSDVGTYDIYVTLKNGNFKFADEDDGTREKMLGGKLTVTAVALELDVSASDITYGQALSDSKLSGTAKIKDSDTVIDGTWAWDETDAAKNPTVKTDSGNTPYTVNFTPTGSAAGNFTAGSLTTKITVKVNRARLAPAIDTVESIGQFDGTTETPGTLKLTGAVLGEAPKATGTFNFDTPTAGTDKTVTVTDIELTDSWGDNYELTTTELNNQPTGAGIGKRVAVLEWRLNGEDKSTAIYSGQPVSVTARVTNPVEGYNCDVIVADGDRKDAGTYTAAASLSDPDNYELPADGTQAKEYTIEKSVVTFTEHNSTTTYDTNPHQVTLENDVTGGAPVLLPGDYTVHYSAPGEGFDKGDMNETRAGTYDVWVQLKDETFKNYEFSDEAQTDMVGTLTVNRANLDLAVTPVTVTYGDKLENALLDGSTARITGEGGASIPGTWAWEEQSGTYPKPSDASHDYKVVFTPAEQHQGNFIETTLTTTVTVTVEPFTLTPLVDSVEGRIYDGTTDVPGTPTLKFAEDLTGVPFSGNKPAATGKFEFTDKNVGTNKLVKVTDIELTENAGDYRLGQTAIENAGTSAEITAKEVTLTWAIDGETGMTAGYTGAEHTVTATAATGVGSEKVNVTVTGGKQTDTGGYTATASGLTDGEGGLAANYILPSDVTQDYAISPASISFTAGAENKADWSAKGETNADPNPGGYTVAEDETSDVWTDLALYMTYDSYNHTVNVVQKADEAAVILPAEANGFTVAYKRTKDSYGNSVAEDTVMEIRDAGTYDILVDLTPTEDGIYNYTFAGKAPDVHSLKIGEIVIEPYAEILLTWTHLKYVYHAHSMHPDLRVQNAFNSDLRRSAGYPSAFRPEDPDAYTGMVVVPFAATGGSDVGEYRVTARLYGRNAGNYRIKNDTETVTIVPAPVTFTVADNIWVIGEDGTLSRDTVTLNAAWGAVTVDPDMAVHHTYPVPGTRVVSDLELMIRYRKDGKTYTEAPAEAGNYEIWAEIGNGNFRHSAAADGASHNVGELIVTDDPDSIKTYTVKFDLGYEGAAGGPGDMERVFANQTVVLPAHSGTRDGFTFQGWSYDGRIYLPNEEFHMPESDVTFKAQWLDESSIRSVGGKVLQERSDGDPAPVFGATVTLKQGSNEIGETGTDLDGVFHFERLVSGIYNLEIRYNDGIAEVVKTFLVDVEAENSLDETYILPEGALNTVVEADITAVADLEGIVEEASDDGIYTNRDAETVAKGGTVEFRMSITSTTLEDAETEQLPVSAGNVGMTLDIELTKTVTEGRAAAITEHITDTRAPITTVIHLPPELQGKSGYTIYRFHKADGEEEPEIQTITVSENENGEYLEVIREGTAVELHAKFYSTYVLAWYQDPEYEEPVTCPVKLPEDVENGSVASDHKEAVFGAKITLTVTPDDGYVLAGLTVTDRSGKAVTLTDNGDGTYSFIMPSTSVTVSAAFGRTACDGGAGCPGKEFSDLDAAAWYHEYTDYVIANGLMHGTGGGIFAPGGTVTRAEMVTVLWNMSGSPVVNYAPGFTDVKDGHWYTEAIRWAAGEGIADGYGNGEFGPNDTVTRQQMATMLYRYEFKYGSGGFTGDPGSPLPFDDRANISSWAYEAVAWCSTKGIIVGKDDGTFDPSGAAQRSELAAVLTRYCREDDISE